MRLASTLTKLRHLCSSIQQRQLFGTMRLVRFERRDGRQGLGVELDDGGDVVDLTAADTTLAANMKDFLAAGESSLSRARR